MKRIILTLSFIGVAIGTSFGQSSKDYEPALPDYSNTHNVIDPSPTAPPPPPPPIPIDGGLGFLLAAGAGYGLKRLRDNKKK